MDKVEFLAIIAPSASALKVSGNGNGGSLILAFDDTQLPQALRASMMREQLLKITVEPQDDYSD
jgi:hypothetical protein